MQGGTSRPRGGRAYERAYERERIRAGGRAREIERGGSGLWVRVESELTLVQHLNTLHMFTDPQPFVPTYSRSPVRCACNLHIHLHLHRPRRFALCCRSTHSRSTAVVSCVRKGPRRCYSPVRHGLMRRLDCDECGRARVGDEEGDAREREIKGDVGYGKSGCEMGWMDAVCSERVSVGAGG